MAQGLLENLGFHIIVDYHPYLEEQGSLFCISVYQRFLGKVKKNLDYAIRPANIDFKEYYDLSRFITCKRYRRRLFIGFDFPKEFKEYYKSIESPDDGKKPVPIITRAIQELFVFLEESPLW